MNVKTLIIFIFLFTAFSHFSCGLKDPKKEEILKVIGKYNIAIVAAYRELNMQPLREITGDTHFQKVRTLINSYLDDSQIMESELLNLIFKEIVINGNIATVKTSEDWKYRWINHRTSEEIEPLRNIHYEMVYHLLKRDAKWIVENIEVLKDT